MEIEVLCQKCNAPLDVTLDDRGMAIYINPCEDCLDAARTEGYEEGRDDGFDEGRGNGYDVGHKDGYDKGYAAGREDKQCQ